MTSLYWISHPDHTDMFTQGYIGVSGNPELRWRQHSQRVCNPHLTNAVNKYGWDNLVKKVVLIADEAYCYAMEAKLRAKDCIGWNITKGGNKPPVVENKGRFQSGVTPYNKGVPMTDEVKAKVSAAKKGQRLSDELYQQQGLKRSGKNNCNYGKKMPDEIKAKISAAITGRKQSDEERKMRSEATKQWHKSRKENS